MKLLSRGLTKITASVVLLMIVITTSILTWTLITTATPNTNHIITHQLPKIESVMYNEQNNELIISIRSNNYNIGQYQILVYRTNGKMLEEVSIDIVTSEILDTGLIVVIVKLNREITMCNEYILQLIVNKEVVRKYIFRL